MVRDRIISFSSAECLFFPLQALSDEVYRVTYEGLQNIQITSPGVQALRVETIGEAPLSRPGDRRWCKGGPKHTSSPQITCELFFLSDRPLPRYRLSVCTRFCEIHLKAIQRCCVRQEASVLAHHVIHSVSCTQRGPSSLVSPLLAFKECMCAQRTCTCTDVLCSARAWIYYNWNTH